MKIQIQGAVSALFSGVMLIAFVPLVLGRPAQDVTRPGSLHNTTVNHYTDYPALLPRSDAFEHSKSASMSTGCFPALGFRMPRNVPGSLSGWWCNQRDEYAFMGFSYAVSEC